jgi:hypothetical protein
VRLVDAHGEDMIIDAVDKLSPEVFAEHLPATRRVVQDYLSRITDLPRPVQPVDVRNPDIIRLRKELVARESFNDPDPGLFTAPPVLSGQISPATRATSDDHTELLTR